MDADDVRIAVRGLRLLDGSYHAAFLLYRGLVMLRSRDGDSWQEEWLVSIQLCSVSARERAVVSEIATDDTGTVQFSNYEGMRAWITHEKETVLGRNKNKRD